MAGIKTASLCWTLLFVCPLAAAAQVQKTITAESGDRVTLPCRAPNNRHITAVDWRRSGLTDKSVLLYRDNEYVPDEQDPSFENRVALQDVKDGDMSLILKNVTTHDTGIYECHVDQQTESHRRKRAVETISTVINLSVVDPPGQPGGRTEDGGKEKEGSKGRSGPGVGLSVTVVLLVAVVGFLIYRKHKQQQNQDPYQPPAEQQQL